jgi:dTDP-4-dehydrorhamnose reductase
VVPVVAVSAALARTEHYGLYHGTANGETTWAEYARFLAGELGLPDDRVQALPTGALALRAPRPRRAVLDNRMLRLRGLDSLGDWQTQARAFIGAGD